jgi:hypothetical protein
MEFPIVLHLVDAKCQPNSNWGQNYRRGQRESLSHGCAAAHRKQMFNCEYEASQGIICSLRTPK